MSLTLDFIKRVAPNNAFPATHFIEIWKHDLVDEKRNDLQYKFDKNDCRPIRELDEALIDTTETFNYKTVAIFKIRENRLPTTTQSNQLPWIPKY